LDIINSQIYTQVWAFEKLIRLTLELKQVKDWLKKYHSENIKKCEEIGGSAWESNPPKTLLAPHTGFEVRGNTKIIRF